MQALKALASQCRCEDSFEHFVAYNCDKFKQSHVPAQFTRPACFAYLISHHLARDSNLGVDDFKVTLVQGSNM